MTANNIHMYTADFTLAHRSKQTIIMKLFTQT